MSRRDDGIKEGVSNRAKGKYNISIPTSLALEYITGVHEERPMKIPPIKHYKRVAINIATLSRNFINSLDPVNKIYLTASHAMSDLYAEINTFKNVLEENGASLALYEVDYSELKKDFPMGIIKAAKTPGQIAEATLIKDFCTVINEFDFTVNNLKNYNRISLDKTDLILTSYPVDLLPNNRLMGASLLESHTGYIKDRHEWGSKLGLGEYKDIIPFSKMSLTLFGDKATHFLSGSSKLKNPLIEHAKNNGWNKKTTEDRMKSSLSRMTDQEVRNAIKSMF